MNTFEPDYIRRTFYRPNTIPPVAGVYCLRAPVGLSAGHEPHYHPDTLEVCYLIRGHVQWWVGTTAFEATGGDLVVMPQMVPHGSLDSSLQPCELFAVHIDLSGVSESLQVLLGTRSAIQPLLKKRPDLGEIVMDLFQEHVAVDQFSPDQCLALTTSLLTKIVRAKGNRMESHSDLIQTAQKELLKHQDERSAIAEAASSLGVSVAWLYQKFKFELGESPGEWLRTQRLMDAKEMLSETELPSSDIATTLGFRSSQYFATSFKNATGLTPSQYRALIHDRAKIRLQPAQEARIGVF